MAAGDVIGESCISYSNQKLEIQEDQRGMGKESCGKSSLTKQMLPLFVKIEHCCETYGRYKKVFQDLLSFSFFVCFIIPFLYLKVSGLLVATRSHTAPTREAVGRPMSSSTAIQPHFQVGESRDFQEGSSLFQEPCRKYSVRALVEFGGGDGKWTNDKSVLK